MQLFDDAEPAEYKCLYCNATFNAQFVICDHCKKERKDIVADRKVTNAFLLMGISFILAAIYIEWRHIVYIFDDGTSTGFNNLFMVSIFLIVLGIVSCTVCCLYYFRVRNKIDFYYLE